MKRTLTSQLFLRTLPTMLVLLLLIGILAFYSCRREINYVYDMEMTNDAQVLWGLIADELLENGRYAKHIAGGRNANVLTIWNDHADDYGSARMFRVWQGNRIVMASDTAFTKDTPKLPEGFTDLVYKNHHWRIYTLEVDSGKVSIEIGERRLLRNALSWNILFDLFIPLLLVVPLLTLGLWIGLRNGLRVMQTLVRQLHERSADDLSTVSATALPRDFAPLSNSINRLFGKLAQSISAERRFADHAAHQLRTPLAGSRLLIQMLKDADSDAERAPLLADLEASNNQATELVNRLLIAARVSYQPVTLSPIPLYPITARILAEMAPLASAKSLTFILEGEQDTQIIADEILLTLVITNIVENAIKYTQANGHIDVTIRSDAAECILTITDTGPGIAEHERKLVFQRFYRAALSDVEGTGLGLAIVADCVARFKGTITLQDGANGQGLTVILRLVKAA